MDLSLQNLKICCGRGCKAATELSYFPLLQQQSFCSVFNKVVLQYLHICDQSIGWIDGDKVAKDNH